MKRDPGFLAPERPALPLRRPFEAYGATRHADGHYSCGLLADAPTYPALLQALHRLGVAGMLTVRTRDGAIVLTETDIADAARRVR